MLYEYAVVWATTTRPSSHLGLKVRTFFNSPGNVDFENDLIFIQHLTFSLTKVKQAISASHFTVTIDLLAYKLMDYAHFDQYSLFNM